LIRKRPEDGEIDWNQDAEASIKLIAAAIVRDFLVVEEREQLFSSRPLRRRIQGRNIRTIVYLPRVRYATPHLGRMPIDPTTEQRSRHAVSQHLRRANVASPAQRFLAMRYGVSLPQGFTFVRSHERGVGVISERLRIYRSRSASQVIFEEVDRAPEGSRPAWFDFEKDCARYLRARGMRVIHQAANRDGDGGVDLYAIDEEKQSWVVQCKCWAAHRPVGPNIVREVEGAIRLADADSSGRSAGMIITTSTFTDGATQAAGELGITLVDGAKLADELRAKEI